MEAYLNELSLKTYTTKKDMKSDFKIVAESISKIKEWSITNIRVSSDFYTHHFLHNCTIHQLLNDKEIFPKKTRKEDAEDDYDLKTLLTSSFGTLEPIDQIQDAHNITSMSIRENSCYGLGLASEFLMNSTAISFRHCDWIKDEYTVVIKALDEDAKEFQIESNSKNISEEAQCENHRTFLSSQLMININSGKELWVKREELFPNLKFCQCVYTQLRGIRRYSEEFTQILRRLFDLQKVAANTDGAITEDKFQYYTTLESDSRIKSLRQKLTFTCLDGQDQLFSWHSRYTPGAGRIHFFPVDGQKIFHIGYIGNKIS